MLATPFSRLNISCTCTECTFFLRLHPKNPPSISLPPGLGFSLPSILPPTPARTPKQQLTHYSTRQPTPRLHPTAPTLAPSPSFLLIRSSPSELNTNPRAALPSLSLSPAWQPLSNPLKKVTFASRSLWAHISSPIDDAKTPISAKTPGLAPCANVGCERKVVPRFRRAVCSTCEEELRGAVLDLATRLEDEEMKKLASVRPSRIDSVIDPFQALQSKEERREEKEQGTEPALVAVPTTPPSTKPLLSHSRNSSLHSTPERSNETTPRQEADTALYALPNTTLGMQPYEDITPATITPMTRYAMDFPILPSSSKTSQTGSEMGSKRNSREIPQATPTVSQLDRMHAQRTRRDEQVESKGRTLLTAEESTMFKLKVSNGSVRWKIH